MKTITIILALSLAMVFVSCKQPKEFDDGRPRITSVSFSGIPDKNVELDQSRQIITVLLPEVLPEQGLIPNFKFSSSAEIEWLSNIDGYEKKNDISDPWCYFRT